MLPQRLGDLEVTAINFGDSAVDETLAIKGATPAMKVTSLLGARASESSLDGTARLRFGLKGYEWQALRLTRRSP